MKKLGILGGSFNPIHLGHLVLAETAREALGLDRVIFIPAKLPPHKRAAPLAAGADRLAMVRLAVAGNPAFSASDIELRRPGVSYTVDTVRALREKLGAGAQIYFLIGMDTVAELTAWREVARLARLCEFVPLSRPGHANPNAAALERAVGRRAARAILKRARRHAADRDLLVRNPPPRRGGPDDPLPRPRSPSPPTSAESACTPDGFVEPQRGQEAQED